MTAAARPTPRPTGPERAPRVDQPRRPPLRVVGPEELAARARRRRARLLIALTSVLAVAGVFGLVAAHVVLTQNQFRLEQLERRAAEEQARYERLRLQVAELESPARIVAAAQERLGMVPPSSVKYLTPAAPPQAPGASPAKAAPSRPKGNEQAVEQWSSVKRHLGSRP